MSPLRKRPLLWVGALYVLILCGLKIGGIPLESPGEAELFLTDKGEATGIISGSLSAVNFTGSGSYALTLSDARFTAEGETESLSAGTVLVYFPVHTALEPGAVLAFSGSLKRFRQADNPGEFDPRSYYLSRGMGVYMEGDALRIISPGKWSPASSAFRVKSYLREGLERLYDPEEAGLLAAVLLGERSGVDPETEAAYETAGLSHLLSVSGLHVSFWALAIGKLAGILLLPLPFSRGRSLLWRRGYGLIRALLAMAAVCFYMLLCGTRIPVQRAGLMALLYQLSLGLGLSFDLPNALAAAALAALIPAPEALFQASFQLSFGCVALLGFVLPVLSRRLWLESRGARGVLVPTLLQTGMLPLQLWHYFTLHPYAVFANLLAVPLAGVILGLGFGSALLAGIFLPAARGLAGVVHILLLLIRGLCDGIAALPFASLVTGRPHPARILAYGGLVLLGMAWILHIRRKEIKQAAYWLALAGASSFKRAFQEVRSTALLLFLWMLVASVVFLLPQSEANLRVTALGVGQGDALVITLPEGGSFLLDGGGGSDTVGERILLPYLKYRGILRLEYIIVSHPDGDHINGLAAVLEDPAIRVGGLLLPEIFLHSEKSTDLLAAAHRAGVPVQGLKAGDYWQAGEGRFEVLYPGGMTQVDDNESSLVLRLSWGEAVCLFTGDLGETGEALLLRVYGDFLGPADVLKVGHHGSRFGTTRGFLEALSPRLALISCGRNNRFGHPAPETLERLQAAGSAIIRTDESGALECYIGKDKSLSLQLFHEKETEEMDNKNEREQNKKSSWILSGLILAAGILAMVLAIVLPGREGETAGSQAALSAATVTQNQASVTAAGQAAGTEPKTEPASPLIQAEAESSWPFTQPASKEAGEASERQTLSPRPVERNGGRGGQAADPQAEGYWLDIPLTDTLYSFLAGDLSNNTDSADPFRSISEDFKQEIDVLAEAFAEGAMTAEALAEALKGKSFTWPDDKLRLVHPLGEIRARCYTYPGRDMELARDRILLTNVTARHYLFVRVYYHPGLDAVRIYVVNGLIY